MFQCHDHISLKFFELDEDHNEVFDKLIAVSKRGNQVKALLERENRISNLQSELEKLRGLPL